MFHLLRDSWRKLSDTKLQVLLTSPRVTKLKGITSLDVVYQLVMSVPIKVPDLAQAKWLNTVSTDTLWIFNIFS